MLETLGYSAVALVRSHENLAAVDGLLFERGVFSPATHMAWTGLTGAALWLAASCRWCRPAVLTLIGALCVAVGLHALWDSSTSTVDYVALALVSLVLLAVAGRRSASITESSAEYG